MQIKLNERFQLPPLEASFIRLVPGGQFNNVTVVLALVPGKDDELIESLEALVGGGRGGVGHEERPKGTRTGRRTISFNSKTMVTVVDSEGNDIPEELFSKIGSGSKVIVDGNIYRTKPGAIGHGLNGIQIVELVTTQRTPAKFTPVAGAFTLKDLKDKMGTKE